MYFVLKMLKKLLEELASARRPRAFAHCRRWLGESVGPVPTLVGHDGIDSGRTTRRMVAKGNCWSLIVGGSVTRQDLIQQGHGQVKTNINTAAGLILIHGCSQLRIATADCAASASLKLTLIWLLHI